MNELVLLRNAGSHRRGHVLTVSVDFYIFIKTEEFSKGHKTIPDTRTFYSKVN